jgi:peptide/nickel transport system permease protein
MAATLLFVLIVAASALAPVIATNVLGTTPDAFMRTPEGRIATLQPPSSRYWLGTDELGRDNFTRLLYAGRVSLTIGFLVAFLAVVIGTALGLVAGYYGGPVDDLVNALVQFVVNLPLLFVLIILSVLFTPTVLSLALIFGAFYWPGTTRQIRGLVLSIRRRDYVDAARVLGASDARILVQHVLPNVASIVMVVAGFDIAAAILGESALSFLGFGVPVPLSSWGNMLSGSQDTFRSAPWLVYPPGAMIFITVLCVFLLADGLRDALDPRLAE